MDEELAALIALIPRRLSPRLGFDIEAGKPCSIARRTETVSRPHGRQRLLKILASNHPGWSSP